LKAPILLLVFALAGVLFWQWWGWSGPMPGPGAAVSDPLTTGVPPGQSEDPINLLAPLGEKEEYASVTERPLFLPDRRPPSEEPEEESPAVPEVPSDLAKLDLNAVLITPTESSAWIRDPAKKELLRVRLGDDLLGWAVKEILTDRIRLERQEEKDTIILRDYKNMPPPAPPRKPPTARKRPQRSPRTANKEPPTPKPRRRDRNRAPKHTAGR
jgi:general secretion pathway protein N